MIDTEKLHHFWLSHLSEEQEEVVVIEKETDDSSDAELIVYNDDYNTFYHVIQCFIEILQHSEQQAEQLSLIIHFNAKAVVKTAPLSVLKPRNDELLYIGLSTEYENYPCLPSL